MFKARKKEIGDRRKEIFRASTIDLAGASEFFKWHTQKNLYYIEPTGFLPSLQNIYNEFF